MKKNLILLLFIFVSTLTFAQKRSEKTIYLRGPVAPVDANYANYKSYSLKINAPKNMEDAIRDNGGSYSPSTMAENLGISGLKNILDGDFRIEYNITRFEYLDARTIQRTPAYVLGLEANVKVKDKDNKLIYQRFMSPKVNTYMVDAGVKMTTALNNALFKYYFELMTDFNSYFLHGPAIKGRYIELTKLPKTTDLNDFNPSAQVFPAVFGVSREEWPQLFGEAQKYWLTLIKYNGVKDEDAVKDVRMAAYYNLAFSNLLLGNMAEADKYLQGVKENDRKFLGMAQNYDNLLETIRLSKEYASSAKELAQISPLAPEPQLPEYKKSSDVFKFVLLEGEVMDKKNEKIVGKIKIMNDNPPVIDYRQQESQGSLVGGLLSSLKVDNSSVYIEVEGAKKPVKRKIDDILFIKTKDGKMYIVGEIGNVLDNSNRYSLLEEVKTHKRLTLYKEFFPQDAYALKRPTEEKFFELPIFGIKKALKGYLPECTKMHPMIDAGDFNSANAQNYIRIFETYTSLCGK